MYQEIIKTSEVSKPSYKKVGLLALVIYESDGLLTKLVGFDTVLGAWLFAFLMVMFLFIALFKLGTEKNFVEIKSFYYPIVAFFVFFSVSCISNSFIFPKSVKDWLPSLYLFTPIFIFYFLYCFNYRASEVVWSFIVVAITTSLLLMFDRVLHFPFLDEFQRRSAFFSLDVRRVVLLKNEVIFGFVAIMSLLITRKGTMKQNKVLIALATFLFLVQAFVMESRMGFLAMGVATLTLMYIKGLTKKVFNLYILGILAVLFLFPIVFAKHIDSLSNMSLHDNESNISIRFETVEHFYHAYRESNGLGIGSMSPNAKLNNILHSGEHNNIVDAGAISSLFQFGPLGLSLWLFFTYSCVTSFHKAFVISRRKDSNAATALAFLMAFTISLWPISFFTASWCIAIGGVLLYLLWYYRRMLFKLKCKVTN